MNLRNNKGFTGVDISVSLIVIVLFVSVIATLVYNFGQTSKAVNRKSTATNIAITKIEEIKQIADYDTIEEQITPLEYRDVDGNSKNNGPYKVTTTIQKYKDSDYAAGLSTDEIKDVIKIVTVNVQYSVGTNQENVEISAIITKES